MGVAVRRLSVDFQGKSGLAHAVRNVSFEIKPGEMLGLVGESGSGKSTVALALIGLLANNARVISGEAEIDGTLYDLTEPGATAPLRGKSLAMIFQDPALSLNPVFTVGAHLDEVLRRRFPEAARLTRRAMAQDALAAVKLSDPARRMEQYPHELSGGMRQRVVIAMALLVQPSLLIADEPTTALDVSVEAQIMAEIIALRDRVGCAVLLITHSLGVVSKYCDRVGVLYAGETLESGPVHDILKRRGHPYTRMLLDCEVPIHRARHPVTTRNRFTIIGGGLPDPRERPAGCIFRDRCDVALADCATVTPADYPVGPQEGHVARCLHLRGR